MRCVWVCVRSVAHCPRYESNAPNTTPKTPSTHGRTYPLAPVRLVHHQHRQVAAHLLPPVDVHLADHHAAGAARALVLRNEAELGPLRVRGRAALGGESERETERGGACARLLCSTSALHAKAPAPAGPQRACARKYLYVNIE
jgi:hypothetical protein